MNPAFDRRLRFQRCSYWLLLFALSGLPLRAQIPVVRFRFENPKLQPAKYVIEVQEDGSGHFRSEEGDPSPDDPQSQPGGSQDRPIRVSQALRANLFAAARKNKFFAIRCEDSGKNIAFQGTKTLEYEGPDGKGSCTYNWSKYAQINKLSDQFEAIAMTLEEGAKLQRQYEHGRLSLDSEIEVLEQMARDGRATEIQNIAPILQTLAGDDAVLQRVQRRARALLEMAKTD